MRDTTKKRLMVLFCATVPLLASATLISDAVDNNGGWTNLGGGFYSAGIGGLAPVDGATFWTAANAGNSRGTWKLFSDTFVEEELKITYFVGDRNDLLWTGQATAFLFADTNEDGLYAWTERISSTATTDRTDPVDGWAEWIDTYSIDAATTTANSDLVLGKRIGFFVVSNVGSGENIAFDALTIETIPEPATLGLMAMIGFGLLGVRRMFML